MQISQHIKLNSILLFFGSLILFTVGLSTQEIIGFDSRFYLFIQEMWRYGLSFFPMTYHQPYPDYPASSTAVIYLIAKLFGGVNKLAAVLPTAILAAATLTLTYNIGSLQHKRWGFAAAMLMLLTSAFIKSARGISLDMYPTAITTACFYLIYSADKENKPQRAHWIYPLLFLGFAFRGPIGLVVPAGVICSYYLINQNFKKFFLSGLIAFLLLSICTGLLLALAHHVGGESFMQDVLRMEILGRMDNHFLPRYFYFTNSFASYALVYPLVWLTLGGVVFYAWRARDFSDDKKFIWQLVGWMLIIMIGMSIPDDKKVRYVLPMLPAIALIAAYPLVAPSSQRYFVLLRKIYTQIWLVFPFLLILLTLAAARYLNINTSAIYIFVLLQIINLMAAYLFKIPRENIFLGIAALSFVIANIMIVEPLQLKIERARDLVISVETQRIHDHAQLVFYREKPDGLPIKYLINMKNDDQPVFIANEKALVDFPERAYFITSESYYAALPQHLAAAFKVIARDTLGHIKVVIFTNKQR